MKAIHNLTQLLKSFLENVAFFLNFLNKFPLLMKNCYVKLKFKALPYNTDQKMDPNFEHAFSIDNPVSLFFSMYC